MRYKPILNLPLPFLVVNSGSLRETESSQYPAKNHPHLHQRQVFTHTTRRPVRERYESGRVVFSRGCALAEPPFGQERLRRVEVTGVPMDAVGMEEKLRLLRDHSAHCEQRRVRV